MKNIWFKKSISCVTLAAFLMSNAGTSSAQVISTALNLPAPGIMVQVSASLAPPILKGIKVDVKDPFKFDFILDTGTDTAISLPLAGRDQGRGDLKDEANKLIRYFLASLAIPEKDLWVNLSPYEKDRIIPDEFSTTEMGRDLLAQDYILKQITASLIYPENETGKAFWKKVYAAAYAKYGTTNVPVDTFNKVWIVPNKAKVYENGTNAFIVDASLKVMLETDYVVGADLASVPAWMSAHLRADTRSAPTDETTKSIIREIILPILEKEVNEGANFAQLRQVYYSLILAKWYKETLKESILNRKYSDQKKISGVDLAGKDDKQAIYEQYLAAFKKGAFNYVKDEYDENTKETLPRKYFSGGCDFAQQLKITMTFDPAEIMHVDPVGNLLKVQGSFSDPISKIDFDPRNFEKALEQNVLRSLAELMDHVGFQFEDRKKLGTSFVLEDKEDEIPGTIIPRRKIKTQLSITVARDITFLEMIGLVEALDKKFDIKRDAPVRRVAEDFRAAAQYLAGIVQAQEIGSIPEVRDYLNSLIKGFEQIAGTTPLPADGKARAQRWLGVNERFMGKVTPKNMERLMRLNQARWARNIIDQINAPYRALDGFIVEKGGRMLQGVGSKNKDFKTLRAELEHQIKQIKEQNLSQAEEEKRVVQLIQDRVRLYFKSELYSDDESGEWGSQDFLDLAKEAGFLPENLASLYEISPVEIVKSEHMVCVMQSYLAGMLIKDLVHLDVYWVNVEKLVNGLVGDHVCVLARLSDGSYFLEDSSVPPGAGVMEARVIDHQELERVIATGSSLTIKLPAPLHPVVRIMGFQKGLAASVWRNLGLIFYKLKRYQEAERSYEKSLELDTVYTSIQDILSDIYYEIGNSLVGQADQDSKNVLDRDVYRGAEKKYREAIRYFEKCFELEPELEGLLWPRLGKLYLKVGQLKKAEESFQKAIELYQQYGYSTGRFADDFYNLGLAYADPLSSVKDWGKAEQSFRQCLKLDPDFRRVKEKLREMYTKAGELLKLDAADKAQDREVNKDGIDFDLRYFESELEQNVLKGLAELMDHVAFQFESRGILGKPFVWEEKDSMIPGTIIPRREIETQLTITIAEDITFLEMVHLVEGLDRWFDVQRDKPVSRVAEDFQAAAKYLAGIVQAQEFGSIPEVRDYLIGLINGFKKVAGNTPLPDDWQGRAEGWLGINGQFMERIRSRPSPVDSIKGLIRLNKTRWAKKIIYEINAPYRALDGFLIEKGGRILDGIGSKNKGFGTLEAQLRYQIGRINEQDRPQVDKERQTIQLIQRRVERYFDWGLYSTEKDFWQDFLDISKEFGISPEVVAKYYEINPSEVVKNEHMLCVMKSYLAARFVKKFISLDLYWSFVAKDIQGINGGHVCILARLSDGSYFLADPTELRGAGAIPSGIVDPEGLARALQADSFLAQELPAPLHPKVVVMDLQKGLAASILFNLGLIFVGLKKYEEAERCYKKALELASQQAEFWNSLGNVSSYQKKYQEAEKYYKRALELAVEDAMIWDNLMRFYLEVKAPLKEAITQKYADKVNHNEKINIQDFFIELDAADKVMARDLGGIDFNPAKLDLERQGSGAALEWDNASFENIEINGLVPVIISITPVSDLPLLMGVVPAK